MWSVERVLPSHSCLPFALCLAPLLPTTAVCFFFSRALCNPGFSLQVWACWKFVQQFIFKGAPQRMAAVFLHSGWLGEAIAIPFVIGAEAPKHTFWAWWWSCLNLIPTCGQVPFRAFAKGAEFHHLVLHYAWYITAYTVWRIWIYHRRLKTPFFAW